MCPPSDPGSLGPHSIVRRWELPVSWSVVLHANTSIQVHRTTFAMETSRLVFRGLSRERAQRIDCHAPPAVFRSLSEGGGASRMTAHASYTVREHAPLAHPELGSHCTSLSAEAHRGFSPGSQIRIQALAYQTSSPWDLRIICLELRRRVCEFVRTRERFAVMRSVLFFLLLVCASLVFPSCGEFILPSVSPSSRTWVIQT